MRTVGTVEVILCRKYGGRFQGLFLDVFFLPVLPWAQRLPKAVCFICLGNWFAAGRKYKNNTQPLSESANMYWALLRIGVSPVSQNMISNPTNAAKPVLNFRGCVQMSFQMWVLWRDWPTTGPGTPCTGPAPPRPPSADTPWTRAERAPSPGRPWSLCQRKTIHTCWPWMSVRSQSRFLDYNIWYWILNMVLWLNASFIDTFIELLLYWHWANSCAVLFQQGKWLCSSVDSYQFIDRLFGLISLAIYLFIALYVEILPRRVTERALKALDFFLFSAAYCNINADKWNWLPPDRRTSLFQAFKNSLFLLFSHPLDVFLFV